MSKQREWPPEVPSTGKVIQQMEAELARQARAATVLIDKDVVRGWMWCVVECAALLDPDNQPLTPDDMARMAKR